MNKNAGQQMEKDGGVLLFGGPDQQIDLPGGVQRIGCNCADILSARSLYDFRAVVWWPNNEAFIIPNRDVWNESRRKSEAMPNIPPGYWDHINQVSSAVQPVEWGRMNDDERNLPGRIDNHADAVRWRVHILERCALKLREILDAYVTGEQLAVVVLSDYPANDTYPASCWYGRKLRIDSATPSDHIEPTGDGLNPNLTGIVNELCGTVTAWAHTVESELNGERLLCNFFADDEENEDDFFFRHYCAENSWRARCATIKIIPVRRDGRRGTRALLLKSDRGGMLLMPAPQDPSAFLQALNGWRKHQRAEKRDHSLEQHLRALLPAIGPELRRSHKLHGKFDVLIEGIVTGKDAGAIATSLGYLSSEHLDRALRRLAEDASDAGQFYTESLKHLRSQNRS